MVWGLLWSGCVWVVLNCVGIRLVCQAKGSETVDEADGRKKRVLVMGGTGRVGGSTLRALSKGGDLHLIVGGRNREKGEALARELGGSVEFLGFDMDDPSALRAAIDGVDLVVHAAGPFQRRPECAVLEAAIDTKVTFFQQTPVQCFRKPSTSFIMSLQISVLEMWLEMSSTLKGFGPSIMGDGFECASK
ncbi:hypothetical protein M758_11G106000 [Ceratodon purpureus]|nr:hypothetical protein M758_11G106000 [Ceratodon purpureus]